MVKIGLLSDTHSYMDDRILEHLKDCDEIWHAGDIGDIAVIEALEKITKVRAVFGNIDTGGIRQEFEEDLRFEVDGLAVYITHIGGYPGRYSKRVIPHLDENPPGLFITGHSHILKVMMDKKRNFLHMNPGACGQHGFHKMRTLIKFNIREGRIMDAVVVELGKRGLN